MLIGRGKHEKEELLLLGLSRGNLDRLTAGRPILLRTATHPGIPEGLCISIIFGETEEELAKLLKNPETKVVADHRLDDNPLGLGATGRFPEGKLRPDDQGGLRAALHIEGKMIVMEFGKNVSWVAITPEEAMEMALALRKHAKKIRTG